MEALCPFPHSLPYISLPIGHLYFFLILFYNKLVNSVLKKKQQKESLGLSFMSANQALMPNLIAVLNRLSQEREL